MKYGNRGMNQPAVDMRTTRCFITPHIAGGRADQDEALVHHFLANLKAFEAGTGMTDRVL